MLKNTTTLLIGLFFVVAIVGYKAGPTVVWEAQTVDLTDAAEIAAAIQSEKGKVLVLNFWASWCPPCKGEMPDIEELYMQTKGSDLIILAVNIGEEKTTAKSFMDKNKYNFTVLLDSNQSIATQYNIAAIPTSFFIDKEGNIISTVKGGMTLEQMKNNTSKL